MKAVILTGGLGTRLSEETAVRPKPMVEIEEVPIIWRIIQYLSYYKIKEFIVCAGYKSHVIKDFFLHLRFYNSDVRIDYRNGEIEFINGKDEEWKVTIVDSGRDTSTGGRPLSIRNHVQDDDFLMTH